LSSIPRIHENKVLELQDVSSCFSDEFCISSLDEYLQNLPKGNPSFKNQFYQILYITEGQGSIRIDLSPLKVLSHKLFFIAPEQIYQFDAENMKGISILFSNQIFSLTDSNPNFLKNLPYFHSLTCEPSVKLLGKGIEEVSQSIERLLYAYSKDTPYREEYIRSHLRILLIDILRHFPCRSPSWESHEPMRKFELLLEEHYKVWKTPSKYAFELGITTNHLNYLCKTSSGKTAGELIRQRILLEAKKLLRHTALPILHIAHELHFEDSSYFSKFFKKYEGLSPETYRYRNQTLLESV